MRAQAVAGGVQGRAGLDWRTLDTQARPAMPLAPARAGMRAVAGANRDVVGLRVL